MLLYGDELEYTQDDNYMKWDNTQPGCGFTNSTNSVSMKCTHTVKHALAYGGSETSLLRMYGRLIKMRTSEPSFKWGALETPSGTDDTNVVSYVREADRFDGFIVLGNLDKRAHLVDLKLRHGADLPDKATVEYAFAADGSTSSDFSNKGKSSVVEIDNLKVESGLFLVLRFSRDEADSDDDSAASGSSSSTGHG